jgi:hypothetical protein
MRLKNNTRAVSKIGYLVKVDPLDPHSFVYATASDTSVIGVATQAVAYKEECEIQTSGTAKVFVNANVKRGSVIRSRKSTDNLSNGQSTIARENEYPYVQVGIAMESGKGLVSTALSFIYYASSTSGSVAWADLTGVPSTFPPSTHNQAWSTITGTPSWLVDSSDEIDMALMKSFMR